MALLTRLIRLLKADLHGVMDQIENRELLLRQHLRDMQASLMQKEAKLKHMGRALVQIQQQYETGEKRRNRLEMDLEIALKNDKDDIGRMLIKKLKPLAEIQADRCRHIDRRTDEIRQFRQNVDRQCLEYERLQSKAAEYFYRSDQQCWENIRPDEQPDLTENDPSEEEIELELLQRREMLKGGATS